VNRSSKFGLHMAKHGLVQTDKYTTHFFTDRYRPRGAGLHWPDLDEYVSVRAILLGRRSAEGSDRGDSPIQE